MKAKLLLSTVALGMACAFAIPEAAGAATEVQQAQSQNWAGYVVGGSGSRSFQSVSGSWVQPAVRCTAGGPSYSATWVGLGGTGGSSGSDATASSSSASTSLEQAGTEANCGTDGSASYFAWYEMVPSAPVRLPLAVHPGDRMSSRVTVSGDTATVTVTNHTTGQSVAKTVPAPNPDTSSAEWVAEAPSACDQTGNCTPLSLADFGKLTFTSATATDTSGHTGTVSDPAWSAAALTMSPGASAYSMGEVSSQGAGGTAGATPSALSGDGSSFSVSWSGSSQQEVSSAGGAPGGYADPGGYGYAIPYPGGWIYVYGF